MSKVKTLTRRYSTLTYYTDHKSDHDLSCVLALNVELEELRHDNELLKDENRQFKTQVRFRVHPSYDSYYIMSHISSVIL